MIHNLISNHILFNAAILDDNQTALPDKTGSCASKYHQIGPKYNPHIIKTSLTLCIKGSAPHYLLGHKH